MYTWPAIFEIDDNGEATGIVHPYCTESCREFARHSSYSDTNHFVLGNSPKDAHAVGTICELCNRKLKPRACGHTDCCVSTGIGDELTFGHGDLTDNGYWTTPCWVCARQAEKHDHAPFGDYWPYPSQDEKLRREIALS